MSDRSNPALPDIGYGVGLQMTTDSAADEIEDTVIESGRPRVGVSQCTLARLTAMIESGEIPVGSALPPQRDLAQTLHVSRASLREALSTLAGRGLLSIEQGRGTFVLRQQPLDAMENGWSISGQYTPAEVFQMRYIIESHAAQLAAMKHAPEDILALHENLETLRQSIRDFDLQAFARIDFEFHGLINRFAQNRLMQDMHKNFAWLLEASQKLPLSRRDRLWEVASEHSRIIEALEMSDPDGAAYYMRQHLSRAAARAGVQFIELG
jgi:GntR family transcriptional repressor for pyruvate dehydrogenase complex